MNKFLGVGRLVSDPTSKVIGQGTSVTNFTIAIDRRFVKQGEERKADFINCVCFGKTSEFLAKYFSKGKMIGICGSIQTRTWDDKDGKKQYTTEVVVDEAYFTEGKGNGNTQASAPSESSAPVMDARDFVPMVDDPDLPF